MIRVGILVLSVVSLANLPLLAQQKPTLPSFDYETALTHEIKPHRGTVSHAGVEQGFNQLHLTLTVSPAGDVVDATAEGEDKILKYWPALRPEVLRWKFIPFEENGKAETAEVNEYLDLVPPERLPVIHLPAPEVRPDSTVTITLSRSGCFGTCPSYRVSISTHRVVFDGRLYVVATGNHTDQIEPTALRELAKKFVESDFYSMQDEYHAGVTDCATFGLSIDIDGHKKSVIDYVGRWVGMPAVIVDLEDAVDEIAHTSRWIDGTDGLVAALKAEGFNFHSSDAQLMLKRASERKQVTTARQLLEAGVPLERQPEPVKPEFNGLDVGSKTGILTAASDSPPLLEVMIKKGVSKGDGEDKDEALSAAARLGNLESIRLLIAYGSNPNADLRTPDERQNPNRDAYKMNGPGSILIDAASSGHPDVVREILRYHPNLEVRGFRQQTAVSLVGERNSEIDDADLAECVRLLAEAGANLNAKDFDGNTPLHSNYRMGVIQELLKLGANINARNNDGETPIFTNVSDAAIPFFIAHGADLTIRNKKGKSVFQAAKDDGPAREEALRKATEQLKKP